MRTTASGTRALAPTTPTTTPELLAAIKAIDACAAGLSHHADFDQADRAPEIRVLLEGVKAYADEALAALDAGRSTRTKPPTSYTPGPWHEHSHRQIGPDEGIVAEVWSAIGWGDAAIQQADANVRLIAAAPELHQALRAILADNRLGLGLVRPRTMKLIRAALAKVEGGAA